ncbi:hypothetical protein J6590_053780 [Homalodisca vitripennis]|nr:hypothetical protein J6590_053780 [Homalodisca vitripennis]
MMTRKLHPQSHARDSLTADCIPLKFAQISSNEESTTVHLSNEFLKGTRRDDKTSMEALLFNVHSGEGVLQDNGYISIEDDVVKSLVKRESPDDINTKLNQKSPKNDSEARASSIPFLPKGESEGQSSGNGLPSLPGLSGLAEGSNPTAVIGGFSLLIMPMSASNIGNALQAGQQLSQFIPSLPG